jgi:DNA-directed RNA polymerase subunit K/omega
MIFSLEDVKKKENNIYKAVVIMGKSAQWFSTFKRTTVEKPIYKSVEEFLEGNIEYEVIKEEKEG